MTKAMGYFFLFVQESSYTILLSKIFLILLHTNITSTIEIWPMNGQMSLTLLLVSDMQRFHLYLPCGYRDEKYEAMIRGGVPRHQHKRTFSSVELKM